MEELEIIWFSLGDNPLVARAGAMKMAVFGCSARSRIVAYILGRLLICAVKLQVHRSGLREDDGIVDCLEVWSLPSGSRM